jgi:hypothetical protein
MADYDALAKKHGGAPSQPASTVDYDALAMQLGGQGVLPVSAPDSIPQRVKDYAGSIVRGISPYAASAAAGGLIGGALGAAGGPPGMLAGAQTGARLGPLMLTAADIGTGVSGTTTPSDVIKRGVTNLGVGPAQPNREQQVLEAIAGGAAGGYGLGSAFSRLAGMTPGVARNALTVLGKRPDIQMLAGAGGAGAPAVAQQYFDVNDPYALAGISLGGSVLGGMVGARRVPPAPSVKELKESASKAYTAAENANVVYSQGSYGSLINGLQAKLASEGYDPDLQTSIATIMRKLADKSGADISAEELENARRIARTAGASSDPSTRRLSKIIIQGIDDFTTSGPQGRAVSGNLADSVENLTKARDEYTKAIRGAQIERLIDRAERRGGDASAIQAQFRALADSEKRMRQFTPEQQKIINGIATGSMPISVLKSIGQLSPFSSGVGLPLNLAAMTYELFGKDIGYVPQNTLMLAAGSTAAKVAANRLAMQQARRLSGAARGGELPYNIPVGQIAVPAAVNVLETSRRLNALGQ